MPDQLRFQPAPELAVVQKPGQAVGHGLLRAARVVEGVGQGHGRAAGERVHREEVLVAEAALAPQPQHRGDPVPGGHGGDQALALLGEGRRAAVGDLPEELVVHLVPRLVPRGRHLDAVLEYQDDLARGGAGHAQPVLQHRLENVFDVEAGGHVDAHLPERVSLRRA